MTPTARWLVYVAGAYLGLLALVYGLAAASTRHPPRVAAPAGFPDRICVTSGCFPLPAGQRLAGKGAYAPGGTSLAVVTDAGRDSTISFVSAADGSPAAGVIRVYAVTTLRLVGWWGDRALVVAFRPEPVTDLNPLDDEHDRDPTDFALVRRLSILAVAPSVSLSSPARTQELIVLPDQILSIDIADRALAAGRTFPGRRTAPAWPARPGVLTALAGLPGAPIAFVVFLAGAVRRERPAA